MIFLPFRICKNINILVLFECERAPGEVTSTENHGLPICVAESSMEILGVIKDVGQSKIDCVHRYCLNGVKQFVLILIDH